MKKILLPLLAILGLGGCVAVPVSDAGYTPVYVAPPAVVVRPSFYYGHYRGGRGGHHHHYR